MESTSSSKVTVEYHDPSGVFPLVSSDIAARLPLRNLNWHSPPRPLRQIKSLHVELVPDTYTQNTLKPPFSRTDSNGPQSSIEIVRGGVKAAKDRRHQIPGFTTTPYLKIFVLRCDDKDAYKETDRKRIREWIKENSQPEAKQNHDACEWLILHVVIPDTVAASEPRWRESSKDPDDLKERKGGSKLIGKSTRTVFDRLRADFNESGKHTVDRVAQIRLVKKEAPLDLLPTPAVAQTYEETQQERENAWADLISKFKLLILGPFDRRVRQYEADIAEQESRRLLPGWNFCTFCIQKEGLAKALESIGLVEDALAIYDELSLGLESVLRDLAAGHDQGSATSFADYTNDIEDRITCSSQAYMNGTSDEMTKVQADAANLFSKDYRESIVRSNISVFDFMCYLFIRQKTLILRLANAQSARLDSTLGKAGGEDLVLTSEVCWRASAFIHTATRTLRRDLLQSPRGRSRPALEVESLVSSWTWAVAGQVLDETSVPALLELTKRGLHDPKLAALGGPKRPSLSMAGGVNAHPQRTSSLPDTQTARELSRPPTRPQNGDFDLRPASSGPSSAGTAVGLPGQAELATYRAELIMIRRRILENLARKRGWYAGWAHARRAEREVKSSTKQFSDHATTSPWFPHCLGPSLKTILGARPSFESAYETVTDMAIKHYHTATQSKSAEALLGDLALLKSQQDDYLSAATYLEHVLPLYADESWESMEVETLVTYANCLRHLQRPREYVQTSLKLLMKIAAQGQSAKSKPASGSDIMSDAEKFQEIAELSGSFGEDVTRPLKSFFSDVHVDTVVSHAEEDDIFSLNLSLGHILKGQIEFDEVVIRLVHADDPTQEIWLAQRGPITLVPGLNKLKLEARTVTYGPFLIDTISLKAKRLCFIERLRTQPEPTPLGITVVEPTTTIRDATKAPPFVFIYPSQNAFGAEMSRCDSIHTDKPRHMQIELRSGHNDIKNIECKLKPTVAGLRLHLADATFENIFQHLEGAGPKGQLSLGPLAPNSTATITIPYTTEQLTKNVTLRLEIAYHTPLGSFSFLHSGILPNELPLDIDVNDIFQLDELYSSFTVRTTTPVPLRILGAELEDSPVYEVGPPPPLPLPLTIFDSEPLNLTYKIRRKSAHDGHVLKKDAALALDIQYQPLDELIVAAAKRLFSLQLGQSPFNKYLRLLLPLLLERVKQNITEPDLVMAALFGEVTLPGFDTVAWSDLTATLPVDLKAFIENWLRDFHQHHERLKLPDDLDGSSAQHIRLSVDVPNIDMVFSTSITLPDVQERVASSPKVLTLGQPINANVRIKHTSSWGSKAIFPNVPTFKIHGSDRQTTFAVDIGNEADTWLIGGQRRQRIAPLDDTEHAFTVLLVPLKLGLQPLPLIEVQPESGNSEIDEHDEATAVSCETHCESAGELVQIVRDIRSAVVHIPELPVPLRPQSRPGTSSTSQAV